MSAEIICDGCGKRAKMQSNNIDWHKPSSWYERGDKDGIQSACSRSCIEKIAKRTGKTSAVLPI